MATMIPSVLSPEIRSAAERHVFKWFQTARNTDDWIVLHSMGISNHRTRVFGETDFVVLAPGLGMFALEVKGGRVSRRDGIWSYTDRFGNTTQKVRGPFDQAREGIFSIVDALKQRLDGAHSYLENLFFGYGVMFPDIEYEAVGIDEDPAQVFDLNDGQNVAGFIRRISDKAKEKWLKLYGTLISREFLTVDDIRYIASLLRGDFDKVVPLQTKLRIANDELISLTKEQYQCLDQLDDNPRCLIFGPAGTGKTLLAIEETKKAAARGERVALFCYNSTLAEWLNHMFRNAPEELRPAYIGTFHKYLQSMVCVQNMGDELRTSEELNQYYRQELPEIAARYLSRRSGYFDRIIVDEAQDLLEEPYLEIMDMILKKGIRRGQWVLFGDFERQAIYSGEISKDDMLDMLESRTSFIRFRLLTNCRNTKQICEEIRTVTGFDADIKLKTRVEGPPVNYLTYTTEEEQKLKLKNLLDMLYADHIGPEQITILSPRRREKSVVSKLMEYEIADYSVLAGMQTTFSTIHAFKGLENTIVILVDIEDFHSEKLMYVALSRARTGLYVLESTRAAASYNLLLQRRWFHGR